MKTLAVILQHNTPQHTNVLYELLKPYENEHYDLVVLDCGSLPEKQSKYTTLKLEENVFFGGALDVMFNYILENDLYDSLLFLNNDLIVGYNFVSSLKKQLDKFDIITPCIIQPEKTQNHWKQMLPWGTNTTREVKWVDLQCPLISKRFIKHIFDTKTTENCIDPLLIRGWGIELYFGVVCETQNWKIGVCDYIPAVHLGSMTLKALDNTNEYCRLAEEGMFHFFRKKLLIKQFNEFRQWGENYKYE